MQKKDMERTACAYELCCKNSTFSNFCFKYFPSKLIEIICHYHFQWFCDWLCVSKSIFVFDYVLYNICLVSSGIRFLFSFSSHFWMYYLLVPLRVCPKVNWKKELGKWLQLWTRNKYSKNVKHVLPFQAYIILFVLLSSVTSNRPSVFP